MQLKVSEGKPSLEEEEVETGPGTKLGIVKLGKVAGKVSLSSHSAILYIIQPPVSRNNTVATCIIREVVFRMILKG